jgi:nicotinate-nucleotide pyrophosphorylase (carboxylating)
MCFSNEFSVLKPFGFKIISRKISKLYNMKVKDSQQSIKELIVLALNEDIQAGDHSSLACVPSGTLGEVKLLVKESGIIAGVQISKVIFKHLEPECIFNQLLNDGDPIKEGDIVFTIKATRQTLLKGERLVLNYMQRMSGIATSTAVYCNLIKGTSTKLLDTRKTTPNNRIFEKMAVKIGGGHNHRFGLYDMIMLKDNHIDFAGGIKEAINKTNVYLKENQLDLKIEIEVRDFEELNEVLKIGDVDRIMLDNFSVENTIKALKLIDGRFESESSGGITKKTIRSYAETGVDYISVGALTHQIKSLDLSLKAI